MSEKFKVPVVKGVVFTVKCDYCHKSQKMKISLKQLEEMLAAAKGSNIDF